MSEQTLVTEEAAPQTKAGKIVRMVLKWSVLGLLAFTCIMAAIRKFGG
jgi:hypothetical protein